MDPGWGRSGHGDRVTFLSSEATDLPLVDVLDARREPTLATRPGRILAPGGVRRAPLSAILCS